MLEYFGWLWGNCWFIWLSCFLFASLCPKGRGGTERFYLFAHPSMIDGQDPAPPGMDTNHQIYKAYIGMVSCIKSCNVLSINCISSPRALVACVYVNTCRDFWFEGLMIDSVKHTEQTKWLDNFWRLPRHTVLQCGITIPIKKHLRIDLLVKHLFGKAQLVPNIYIYIRIYIYYIIIEIWYFGTESQPRSKFLEVKSSRT